MTNDADRLLDLDEALGKIGKLAYQAWEEGTVPFAEVVEEVVLTCSDLLDGRTDETVRGEIESVLPSTWCQDLPLKERLRNLVEARQAWANCDQALQERLRKLELMAHDFGDPPLAVDPDTVVHLRTLLANDPRSIVVTGETIELLKAVFGVSYGPTHIEPSITCTNCRGEEVVDDFHLGPLPCVMCRGTGRIPDVEGMRLRIAELEEDRRQTRDIITKVGHLMAWLREPRDPNLAAMWLDVDMALGHYRNCGYENSDHPDDFTAPNWSASDLPPVEADLAGDA